MHHDVIKIFIGYDPVESVAWHTMAHSLLRKSSRPLAIIPVNIANIKSFYIRDRDPKQSNEFSFSRFLVPYLCDFKGMAIFFDCDMLLRDDVSKIFDVLESDPGKAVYVVKHDYEPRNDVKYLNSIQYKYPRKNWSSVILWNCEHPSNRIVDANFVNNASPLDLHRFTWLNDNEIGNLDVRWNWLVGEYIDPPSNVKNVHWTIGGPYFHEYKDSDFSDEWFSEFEKMTYCAQKNK
jgi:hypothetical protein